MPTVGKSEQYKRSNIDWLSSVNGTMNVVEYSMLTNVKQLSTANMMTSMGVVWLATQTLPKWALFSLERERNKKVIMTTGILSICLE
jgi:hypothetical protein